MVAVWGGGTQITLGHRAGANVLIDSFARVERNSEEPRAGDSLCHRADRDNHRLRRVKMGFDGTVQFLCLRAPPGLHDGDVKRL